MATADRIYEAACECRELESRLDRLVRDVQRRSDESDELRLRAGRLLEALEASDHGQRPGGEAVRERAAALRELL